VIATNVLFGPNLQTVELQLPAATTLWAFAPEGGVIDPRHQRHLVALIPNGVRRLYWIANAHGALSPVFRAMPHTKLIHHGVANDIYVSLLDDNGFNQSVTWEGQPVRFIQVASGRRIAIELEDGFGNPEGDGKSEWIWAGGPMSQFRFPFHRATRARLILQLEVPVEARQAIDIDCNGERVGVGLPVGDASSHTVDFKTVEGANTCRLHFTRWNRHPVAFAPDDPRPLAASITRLAVQEGNHLYLLFP
jgi:hypothetical protein